ncbi:MAG: hypothetical protein ACKO3S_03025 [bacterium]
MSATTKVTVQAFVELRAEDAEAVSALAVARARLKAGKGLRSLRRVRVFELTGALPSRSEVETLLHRSTRFYNPAKERCTVRAAEGEATPFRDDEQLVLVVDRGLDRRPAAERWWRHETGARVEVREGLAWALAFDPGVDAERSTKGLAEVRDRARGLLANPHFQDWRPGAGPNPPFPWVKARPRARKEVRS